MENIANDTINAANGAIHEADNLFFNPANIWMWVAIIQFLLIIYLVIFKKKTESTRSKFKREGKSGEIDFENIINSSFNVQPLYDDLKVKCHPDRFPTDPDKNEIALKLFQEISKNRTNYKKLLQLKEVAKEKLNINF